MIGYLSGKVLLKKPGELLLDVQGVGYEIAVPVSVSEQAAVGLDYALYTHLSVREDGHYLYGFNREDERQLFRELIRVSGIGPKSGLLILSGFSVGQFVQIIREQNSAALVQLPGIGKKTAERLLIELHDRIAKLGLSHGVPYEDTALVRSHSEAVFEAEEALVALGYKQAAAAKMVAQVVADSDTDTLSTDRILREALRQTMTAKGGA